PPESSPGNLCACSRKPTRSSRRMPLSSACSAERPSTLIWARVRLRMTVRWGNSSKCWNTMPMRARSFGRLVAASPTDTPSTTMRPCSNGSSPLTHLISVDLPEPDGPHTTTTSPLATRVEQPLSTCTVPYHLLTPSTVIMSGSKARSFQLSSHDGGAALDDAHALRGRQGDDEVDQRRKQVHLDQAAVALRHLGGGAEEVGDRQDVDQRRVLEQDDGLREQDREHVAERLRQHDVAHGGRPGHAERQCGRDL